MNDEPVSSAGLVNNRATVTPRAAFNINAFKKEIRKRISHPSSKILKTRI